ncbi:MAG: serine/threonine protein phosphatase, partial [Spirochaetaceae bacterium]|nr:serine/threonine protein phosphatase [Spirochaetaceae bacterium]
WVPAPDASGIVGYSYVWSRNPDEPVPLEVTEDPDVRFVSNAADKDGEWYFRIRAVDRIGNWSEPGTTIYFRDTTTPGRVRFLPPMLEEDGDLASNTFSLRWDPPLDDVIGGYSYDLVYVAGEDADVEIGSLPIPVPRASLLITDGVVQEDNFDNGLWALSVTAIDSVGNIGEPAVLYVRMNKYIPVTEIWAVVAIQDSLGRYNLEIVGRGFLANGPIIQVILDQDQKPPYDYVYDRTSPGFRIFGDRNMAGPTLDDIQTGSYSLGLVHAERGLAFARDRLVLERNGTIKFGDFTVVPGTAFTVRLPRYGFFRSVGALAWVVIALLAVVVGFSATRIVAVTRDGRFLRLEARALIASRPLPSSGRPERIAEMRKRGIGLRAKFAFFVVILIMGVVAMMAIGLGTATLNNQRQILLQGLKDRVDVLMESILAGAAVLLPEPEINIVGLTDLPRRTSAMDEALYATITGEASAGAD